MWKKRKLQKKQEDYQVKDISLSELKKAIQEYSLQLPDGVPLGIIVNEDLSLDYKLLAPYLKGIPRKKYYMSKETYDIFEEQDYQQALDLDMIQKAVDDYIMQTDELPVISGDPYKKVSFHKLERLHLIPYRPEHPLYISNEEDLVTYKKPD
ncbi:DUF3939 domain-containing protein [Aquibacillus albus]|uniref:DUF3939 domain-containing protein n=1 Tax=Aquibacillus albus TaxID=1168171 RepID=A0ABS2MZZ5_9BACI|nr:DUF3939 domain-containing protein [Aquibacillus albus]MBM7571475.1 hypothetical protein [Aquibacillus albus]